MNDENNINDKNYDRPIVYGILAIVLIPCFIGVKYLLDNWNYISVLSVSGIVLFIFLWMLIVPITINVIAFHICEKFGIKLSKSSQKTLGWDSFVTKSDSGVIKPKRKEGFMIFDKVVGFLSVGGMILLLVDYFGFVFGFWRAPFGELNTIGWGMLSIGVVLMMINAFFGSHNRISQELDVQLEQLEQRQKNNSATPPSLISCPMCKNDVSSAAGACPKCGHPIAD